MAHLATRLDPLPVRSRSPQQRLAREGASGLLRWRALEELLKDRSPRRIVTVSGVVVEMDPEEQDFSGVKHQIFIIRVDETDSQADGEIEPGERLVVSVRFGDPSGLPRPIEAIAPDQPIGIRGAYITPEEARINADEERLGVLHFTHRPLGWVKYRGRIYS